jgi:hypothetical protein
LVVIIKKGENVKTSLLQGFDEDNISSSPQSKEWKKKITSTLLKPS